MFIYLNWSSQEHNTFLSSFCLVVPIAGTSWSLLDEMGPSGTGSLGGVEMRKKSYRYFSLKIVIATAKTRSKSQGRATVISYCHIASWRHSHTPTNRHCNLKVYYMSYFAFCFVHIYNYTSVKLEKCTI